MPCSNRLSYVAIRGARYSWREACCQALCEEFFTSDQILRLALQSLGGGAASGGGGLVAAGWRLAFPGGKACVMAAHAPGPVELVRTAPTADALRLSATAVRGSPGKPGQAREIKRGRS